MSGFNIPYLIGNTYLRDCQNWPTLTRAQLPTFYPDVDPSQYDGIWQGSLTAAQQRMLSWRVREWRVDGSFAINFEEHGPLVDNLIVGNTVIAGSLFSLTTKTFVDDTAIKSITEPDLLKVQASALFRALVNFGDGIEDGGVFPTSTWDAMINGINPEFGVEKMDMGVNIGTVLFDPVTNLFTPSNRGLSRVGGGFGAGLFHSSYFQADVTFKQNPSTVLSGTAVLALKQPVNCTVSTGIEPDFVLPMELSWRAIGETPGDAVSGSAVATLTMTATKFWPYSNTLGQAIYDETTGALTGADPFA